MSEIVDILDQQYQVINKLPKEVAHKKGLLHPCIIAELIDCQGNWTLVKQASDRQDPGQYVSPVGGHIQAGEPELAALTRETFEELGITQFTSKFIGRRVYNRYVNSRQENHLFILYEIFSDQAPKLNHESVSYQKFSPQELHHQLVSNPKLFGEAFHFVIQQFYPNRFQLK